MWSDILVSFQATQELREAYKDPNIVQHLFNTLCMSQNVQVRQYSAVLLRKKLYRRKAWKKLPVDVQSGLKGSLLQRIIAEKEKPVVLAIGQLVAIIAKHECQTSPWTELQQLLSGLTHSKNVEECRLGFYIVSVVSSVAPEMFHGHFRPLFGLFSTCLQSCSDEMICFYVIKSMTSLVSCLGSDDANCFQQIIPFVMEVIRRFASVDEDKATEAMELFDELIDSEIAILLPHIKPLVKMCVEIAREAKNKCTLRVRAMHILGWLVNVKKKTIVKHKLIPELLDALFPVMVEVSEEDLEQEEREEEDERYCQTPSASAGQLLDTMALHLPPEKLLPHLSQHVEKGLASKNPLEKRAAYIAIAVIAEGCSEAIRQKHLPSFVHIICQGVVDVDSHVRNAALFALGQFADFLQPEIGKYVGEVLPILLGHLGHTAEQLAKTGKDPPNLCKTFYALETFCENLEEELVTYLPAVMERVLLFLTAPSYRAKELAISAIGSAANATKEAMLPYFPEVINHLKQYLTEDQTEHNATLRTQAVDTLGCFARTIGSANFLPMAAECVQLGLRLIDAVDDPDLRRSTYGMLASVSSVLKADMTQYLEPILDHMFTSLKSTEGVVARSPDGDTGFELFDDLEDSDDEAAEEILSDHISECGMDDEGYAVENAYLEEKEDTCAALAELAENVGPAFVPYLDRCFDEVSRMADYPAPDVQKAGLTCLGQLTVVLFKSATQVGGESEATITEVARTTDMLIPKLVNVCRTEQEREVVLAALETLALLINELKSAAFQDSQHINTVVSLVKDAFNNKLASQDPDSDGEDAEEREEAEYDGLLIQMAGDLVPALAKALPAERFAPYMAGLLPLFMGKLKKQSSTTDKSYAIGTLAEVVQGLGQAGVGPFCRPLLQVFLSGMRDRDSEVRSNAVFGLGLLIQNAPDILAPDFPSLLEALSAMLSREDSRHAKDNICGAVARLILAGVAAVPMADVFPALLQHLPLEEDFEENATVFHCICYLYSIKHEEFVKNLPSIIRVILRVIGTDQVNPDTKGNLVCLVKSMSSEIPNEVQTALQTLTPVEKDTFNAMLTSS